MDSALSIFINKITKDVPEIGWDNNRSPYFLTGELFASNFEISYNIPNIDVHGGELMYDAFEAVLSKYGKDMSYFFDKEEIYYGNHIYAEVDTTTLTGLKYDIFVECLKEWIKSFESIKKTDKDKDQIVLIHPDCDNWTIPSILKDFSTIIKGDSFEFSVGIVSTSKWNFSNRFLCEELQSNSGDCFGIGLTNKEELLNRITPEMLSELLKVCPNALELPIYTTDWD